MPPTLTRPATLSDAVERIARGDARDAAIAEFLAVFYAQTSPEARLAMLTTEPALTGDARLDALLGAIGEYLAKQYRLSRVPAWVGGTRRMLAEPWFTGAVDSDAMREYLTVSSPAEFARRNIFTESMPLRRARRPEAH
jgi:hypothetical protein